MSNINLLFFNILSKFIWTLIDTRRSDRRRDATAAIAASVVETTHQPGLFSSTTLSRPQANFLHQTCIGGLVKHLSPYTGHISEWMVFGQRLFAQRKWITERCSLRDAFSGSVAIFIRWQMTSQWRHRNKTHSCYSELNYVLQNLYFGFFYILKINRIMPFCNLFMGRSSYFNLVPPHP